MQVIETVAELDLSYNKLTNLDGECICIIAVLCCHGNVVVTGLCGFIGVTFLNVKHNLIHKSCDLDQLMKLGHLSQLHLVGK